ncbi:MAG: hypothetical protein LUI14_08415 [Lachnospiraceae bacterium]|nr:hypothetical protein [Lachnospiraceae bacterium]
MSKFSMYLKELLDQRGEPIARIAKNAGLERTSIHKALKDERILPYTSLNQLTRYLQLTLSQTRELNQYYEMLLQGEEIFLIQEDICDLLSGLSQLSFYSEADNQAPEQTPIAERFFHGVCDLSPSVREVALPLDTAISVQPGLVYGKMQVEKMIHLLLRKETVSENAEFYLSIPSGETMVQEALFHLWSDGRVFSVHQMVAFLPQHFGKETTIFNLKILRAVIPMALISQGRYHPYYYFESNADSVSVDPFPYYIITPEYVLRLDEKMSTAQLLSDENIVELYRTHYVQLMRECQPLTSYSNDLAEVLEAYMMSTDETGYYTIMTQPCLGHYYTRKLMELQFREDIPDRDKMIELSDRRFDRLRRLDRNYYTVFTEQGIRQFAENGVAADLPPDLVKPGSPQLRLELLGQLRKDIASGVITGCITDASRLDIPDYLTLTADPQFGLHIYAIIGFPAGPYTCNLHIQESSIGQSFCSFIKSLPGSKFVYPQEKTLSILDELIAQLEMET